jgi:hypothetical protein
LAGALSLLARKEVIAFVRRTGQTALLRMRPSAFTNVPGLPRCLAGPTKRRPGRRGIGRIVLNSSARLFLLYPQEKGTGSQKLNTFRLNGSGGPTVEVYVLNLEFLAVGGPLPNDLGPADIAHAN